MLLRVTLLLCVLTYAAARPNDKNTLDCDFNAGDNFCRWNMDPRDQTAAWESMNFGEQIKDAACMRPVGIGLFPKHSARLWSSWLYKVAQRGSNAGVELRCLKFSYRIESNEDGGNEESENEKNVKNDINLALLKHSSGNCESQKSKETGELKLICRSMPIWVSKGVDDKSGAGNDHNGWAHVNIDLKNSNNDFKLILEGTIPSGNPSAKICVDNITSSADPCEKITSELSKGIPSFHSWVEIFGMTFAGALALGLTIPIAVFVVCLFERKRQRGKKSNRIIRHADELDLPEAMTSASCDETNPMPQRYPNPQVGVGHPRLMGRAMSTPAGTNGQGGSYTMGKRNGPQPVMGPRSASGQMSHTMGRGGIDGGWMMSSQHGDLMENDEYTIDPDYTTHRQMSVPANGYIPVASNMNQMDQGVQQAMMYQNRPIPQPQVSAANTSAMSNNPFGTPVTSGVNVSGQDTRSLAGSHAGNFSTDDNRATPALPFYPPRYEEAMGFNQGQVGIMDEKPPLLPPRIPDGSGSSSGGGNTSCSTPLPPAPPPLPMSGHPSAGRFMGGNEL